VVDVQIVLQLWKQRSFSGGETGSRTGAEFVSVIVVAEEQHFFSGAEKQSGTGCGRAELLFSVAGEQKFAPTDGATKKSRERELLHTHHLYSVPIKIYLVCLATCVDCLFSFPSSLLSSLFLSFPFPLSIPHPSFVPLSFPTSLSLAPPLSGFTWTHCTRRTWLSILQRTRLEAGMV